MTQQTNKETVIQLMMNKINSQLKHIAELKGTLKLTERDGWIRIQNNGASSDNLPSGLVEKIRRVIEEYIKDEQETLHKIMLREIRVLQDAGFVETPIDLTNSTPNQELAS